MSRESHAIVCIMLRLLCWKDDYEDVGTLNCFLESTNGRFDLFPEQFIHGQLLPDSIAMCIFTKAESGDEGELDASFSVGLIHEIAHADA